MPSPARVDLHIFAARCRTPCSGFQAQLPAARGGACATRTSRERHAVRAVHGTHARVQRKTRPRTCVVGSVRGTSAAAAHSAGPCARATTRLRSRRSRHPSMAREGSKSKQRGRATQAESGRHRAGRAWCGEPVAAIDAAAAAAAAAFPITLKTRRGEDVATDKGVAHRRGLGVAHWRGGYSENATSTGTGTGRRCRRVLHSRGLLVGQAARACPGVAPRQAHRQRRPHLCASCPVSGPGCAGAARREQPPVPQRRVSGRVAGAAARCARRLCTPPRRSPVEYSLHATRPAYMPAAGLPVVVGDTCQHASLCACACSFADMW